MRDIEIIKNGFPLVKKKIIRFICYKDAPFEDELKQLKEINGCEIQIIPCDGWIDINSLSPKIKTLPKLITKQLKCDYST